MKPHNIYLLFVILIFFVGKSKAATRIKVLSPDKQINVVINIGASISMTISHKSKTVVNLSNLYMKMSPDRVMGQNANLLSQDISGHDGERKPVVANKNAIIHNHYNELKLVFDKNYSIVVRAYNDGVAYRFIDQFGKNGEVIHENLDMTFSDRTFSYFPQEESMYSHNERSYLHEPVNEIAKGDFCSLPVLFQSGDKNILFTESALQNYPSMFLASDGNSTFSSKFPKYVLEAVPNTESSPDRNQILKKEANYIATTDGSRAYPWRVFIINDDDRALVASNLVNLLANPPKSNQNSWIKPGKVAWDWYNSNILHGVDFESGINTQTYKYYIDFAAKNNIEYVILDEGWTKSTTEIMDDNANMDVPEIIRYGKSKGVHIILWVLWKPLDENTEEILKLYHSWGAAGVKVDFMQRSDQYMVRSYENIAEIAHGLEMLVDYHGAFKPAGIERVWPNVISYEGVKGNENNKWSKDITPEHNVTLPFIRMVAGPMDFTPGSMLNTNEKNFAIRFDRPMSMGTRAHQVAMYVVYESPLQMMCESPSIYLKEQETVDFITQIPTVWDETQVLRAAVSDYIVLARRKGDTWYVGAMTDWTERHFSIDLSFLGEGSYDIESFGDGINAAQYAPDYKIRHQIVKASSKIDINLASGGGWSAIIKRK